MISEEIKNSKPRFRKESVCKIRERFSLSQNEMARGLMVSAESIRNWEHGRSTPNGNNLEGLRELCKSYQVDPPDFFSSGDENKEPPKSNKARVIALLKEALVIILQGEDF